MKWTLESLIKIKELTILPYQTSRKVGSVLLVLKWSKMAKSLEP